MIVLTWTCKASARKIVVRPVSHVNILLTLTFAFQWTLVSNLLFLPVDLQIEDTSNVKEGKDFDQPRHKKEVRFLTSCFIRNEKFNKIKQGVISSVE